MDRYRTWTTLQKYIANYQGDIRRAKSILIFVLVALLLIGVAQCSFPPKPSMDVIGGSNKTLLTSECFGKHFMSPPERSYDNPMLANLWYCLLKDNSKPSLSVVAHIEKDDSANKTSRSNKTLMTPPVVVHKEKDDFTNGFGPIICFIIILILVILIVTNKNVLINYLNLIFRTERKFRQRKRTVITQETHERNLREVTLRSAPPRYKRENLRYKGKREL